MNEETNRIIKTRRYINNWRKLWSNPELTVMEKVIIKDLEFHVRNRKNKRGWPTIKELSENHNVNRSTIKRAIEKLEQKEILTVTRRKNRNYYKIQKKLIWPFLGKERISNKNIQKMSVGELMLAKSNNET